MTATAIRRDRCSRIHGHRRRDSPSRVHPEVLAVTRDVGIDLSQARPQLLTSELASRAQLLIAMGCGDDCPYVPGLRRDDWPLEDPKGKPLERVREIRDDVRERVATLVT